MVLQRAPQNVRPLDSAEQRGVIVFGSRTQTIAGHLFGNNVTGDGLIIWIIAQL